MRKKFAPAAVAAALLALAIALAGCSSGPSDEDVIRQGVSEELAAIKAVDDEFISSVEEDAGEDLKTLGIDARDFMSAYLDGFDYSVGNVKVDCDSATVHLSITCRSMGEATEAFMGAYGDALADAKDLTDTDALYELAGKTLLESLSATQPKTVECDVQCQKDSDGNWSYADGVSEQMTELFLSQ